MLIFILVKALIVHIIESNSCNSKNGSKNNVLSCKGCTVVLDCALNKTETKPVWSALNNPALMDNKRLQVIENYSSKLQVSDLIKSDEDTYCCYAIRRDVSEQYCTWLQIIELVILPNDNTIVGTNGSTFTVTCSIKNNIPGTKNISWIKNGKIVNSSTSNKLSLTFSLTKEIEEQNLTCKAVIGCIDMPLERFVRFNVTYPPIVKVTALPSSELNEKDNISLSCTYNSNPYPSFITWTKNQNNISHDAEYTKINISRDENGLYVCNVSNSIGYGVAKVQISVFYPPKVAVEQLQNGSLFCNVSGVPNNYTFSKWEHRSSNGDFLRELEDEGSSLLTIDVQNDNPIYTSDGLYYCRVRNGIPDKHNITLQTGFKDIYFPGKPHCCFKTCKIEDNILWNSSDSAIITFDVYSFNITHFDWYRGNHSLNQNLEYEFTTNPSITSVSINDVLVSLNTTKMSLKISNLTEAHFKTQYTLYIYNEHGASSCSIILPEGRVPAKPEKFKVKPLIGSFQVSWKLGKSGNLHQHFIIAYRPVLAINWTRVEHLSNKGRQTVQGLHENMKYIIYMYARNDIGKSDDTLNVTIQTLKSNTIYITVRSGDFVYQQVIGNPMGTNCAPLIVKMFMCCYELQFMIKISKDPSKQHLTITFRSQQQDNSLFRKTIEKLLISLTATLLVIVTFILCCLFGRQYRTNRRNAPSTRNQSNTANINGHYEEIDAALEINVNNSLSPGNNQIDNHEMHDAEQMPMPNSILTIREIVEETMRDISMRVLTETTAKVVRENQLKLIKETVRQVLKENNDLQPNYTHSTSSTESEHDTNDENGYLNPYQPLNINVDSCEHPYADTTPKDDTLNICKTEIKNYPIDTLSFHSENVTSEL